MIRNIYNILILSVGLVMTVNSQDLTVSNDAIIKADTTQVDYEQKLRPALSYDVDIDAKTLKKYWKKHILQSFNATYKIKEKIILATEDITIPSISDKRMNLYATIIDKSGSSKISFSGAFGYDIYIDKDIYSDEFKELKLLGERFLIETHELHYSDITSNLSKNISKLNKSNLSLEKKNLKLNASIKKGEEQLSVLTATNEEEEDTAKAAKTLKKINKLTKKQAGYETDIVNNNNTITENKEQIEFLKKDVDDITEKTKTLKAEKKILLR